MQIYDAAATAARLPYPRLLPALATVMDDLEAGRVHAPVRTAMPLPGRGTYLVMPSCDDHYAVTKLVAITPANQASGLPTLQGQVLVADAVDGRPLALFDGPTLTARRTAGVTLLGIATLLGHPPRRVTLVGTGTQASAHALAMASLWPLECLRVVGHQPGSAETFAARLAHHGVAVVPSHLPEALADCDCVVTLTSARQPVQPEAIDPKVLVVGTGAFTPAMAELPPGMLRTRAVFVDDLPGAHEEAGDLLNAGIDWSAVRSLASCLSNPDWQPPPGPLVFKTVGHAAWDLAAVRVALGS